MAVTRRQTSNEWFGTAAERVDFTDVAVGAKFFETDTNLKYVWTGDDWVTDAEDVISLGGSTAVIGRVGISQSSALTHSAVSVGDTTTTALAANADRKYALLVNDSDSAIYLMIGAAAVANQGIRINANGGAYEMSAANGNLDTRAINAISAIAGKILLVTEGE